MSTPCERVFQTKSQTREKAVSSLEEQAYKGSNSLRITNTLFINHKGAVLKLHTTLGMPLWGCSWEACEAPAVQARGSRTAGNILVNDSFDIVGVIHWEWACTARPRQRGLLLPMHDVARGRVLPRLQRAGR